MAPRILCTRHSMMVVMVAAARVAVIRRMGTRGSLELELLSSSVSSCSRTNQRRVLGQAIHQSEASIVTSLHQSEASIVTSLHQSQLTSGASCSRLAVSPHSLLATRCRGGELGGRHNSLR